MKKLILGIVMVSSFMFVTACADNRPKPQAPQAGVQSSIFQMGTIEKIRVIDPGARINAGCSSKSPVIHTPAKNQTYDVIAKIKDWYALKLPNNEIGFIPTGQSQGIIDESKKPAVPPSNRAPAQGATAPKTPITKANANSLSAAERQMIQLVNQARAQNKVPPLKADLQLSNVARVKAQDMIDNKYFSHNSPKYGSPFDMMKSFGIKYIRAGENIAGNQSVQNAFNALMNSPGHRRNMLDPNFTNIGIGIRSGGPYGNMFSQMFISKSE